MGHNGEEGARWKLLLAPGLGLREPKSISEALDPELEILGSRSSLVLEREPLWALKDSSLRTQDLAFAATAARLAAMAMVPWCWLFLPTRQELRAVCLELVQGQVVQAARRNSWMSLSALVRLVH